MAVAPTVLTLPTEILQDIVDYYFLLLSSSAPTGSSSNEPQNRHAQGLLRDPGNPMPSSLGLLLVCIRVHEIALQRLYTHLEFRSASRLKRFEKSHCNLIGGKRKRPPYDPRTITISIHNDIETRLFERLHRILSMFSPSSPWSTQNEENSGNGMDETVRDERGRLVLDRLSLQCYSHAMDMNVDMISLALKSVK